MIRTIPKTVLFILYTLAIFSVACSHSSDSGFYDTSDGDLDTDKDTDRETLIDSDNERDGDADADPDFDIEKKPDGDDEESIDIDKDPDIETEGDLDHDPEREAEIEADADPEPDIDPEVEVDMDLDPEPDLEPDLEPELEHDENSWRATLAGEIRTSSLEPVLSALFEIYLNQPPGDGATPVSVVEMLFMPVEPIPGGGAVPFEIYHNTGGWFYIRAALDLNMDGSYLDNDQNTEFGSTVGEPFHIRTWGAKRDIRILLDYNDPQLGSIGGKIRVRPGYHDHDYSVLHFDHPFDIDNPTEEEPFGPVYLFPPDQQSGSISYLVQNLPNGTYYLYAKVKSCLEKPDDEEHIWIEYPDNPLIIDLGGQKDLTDIDLDYSSVPIECVPNFCAGYDGNDIGVGLNCTYGGNECPEGLICLKDINIDGSAFCTKMDCLPNDDCGSDAICLGTEELSVCAPNVCIENSRNICPGDAGNDIGVGRLCTQGGGECQGETSCGHDLAGNWPDICMLIGCTSSSECGSEAECISTENGVTACLPSRCVTQTCMGEGGGNLWSVGRACSAGGGQCPTYAQCLSDYYPEAPDICSYIDCEEDWQCGTDAFCIRHDTYTACIPERCILPPAVLCPGDAGNELGVGKACSLYGDQCPDQTFCLSDFIEGDLEICTVYGCDSDDNCGSGAKCQLQFDQDFGICLPDRCSIDMPCIGDTGNELGIGKTCTPGGGECPAATACLADLYEGESGVCVITGCTSHEMCGNDAACGFDSDKGIRLCSPLRCMGRYTGYDCEGDAGNEYGVGKTCQQGADNCPGNLICVPEVEPGGPEICILLHCSTDAECGTDAICIDTGMCTACVPLRCIYEDINSSKATPGLSLGSSEINVPHLPMSKPRLNNPNSHNEIDFLLHYE